MFDMSVLMVSMGRLTCLGFSFGSLGNNKISVDENMTNLSMTNIGITFDRVGFDNTLIATNLV